LACELAVAGQRGDPHPRKGLAQTVEETYSGFGIGVPRRWQQRPQQRHADAVPLDREHQEIDLGPSEVPVGPVDRQNPRLAIKAKEIDGDLGGACPVQPDKLEEPIEAPPHRSGLSRAVHMRRQPPQAHRAVSHDQQHQPS
jgi:hypothetical protein